MTRSRADGDVPTALMTTYYAQRASAGLLITEGIQPSPVGQGYPNTPGLHSPEQVKAWRHVTDAVHARGGVIFAQLMHTGRIGHPTLQAALRTPVGASPVRAQGQVFTATGMQNFVVPEPLSHEEILGTIDDFVRAARNAIDAGFDGVELHGANGYLLHQFLSSNANVRDDGWGAPPRTGPVSSSRSPGRWPQPSVPSGLRSASPPPTRSTTSSRTTWRPPTPWWSRP